MSLFGRLAVDITFIAATECWVFAFFNLAWFNILMLTGVILFLVSSAMAYFVRYDRFPWETGRDDITDDLDVIHVAV